MGILSAAGSGSSLMYFAFFVLMPILVLALISRRSRKRARRQGD
jgi:hypothetical protein